MIGEWVTRGAGIGISAFVAVIVFGVLALACLGFLALGAKVLKEDDNANEEGRYEHLHRR